MGFALGLVIWMLTAVVAAIISGGPPPMFQIMVGTVVIVFVGLLAISSAEDRRVERLRPLKPAVEDPRAEISPGAAGTDRSPDPSGRRDPG
jgi:threonine/homoserine/homoserine lactone efflux protein